MTFYVRELTRRETLGAVALAWNERFGGRPCTDAAMAERMHEFMR